MVILEMDCRCVFLNTGIFAYSSCGEDAFHFSSSETITLSVPRNDAERLLRTARGERQSGSRDGYGRRIRRHTNKESKRSDCEEKLCKALQFTKAQGHLSVCS